MQPPSNFSPYSKAIDAKFSGDLATARAEFSVCLAEAQEEANLPMTAFFLANIGDVEALAHNRDGAIEVYEQAISADPNSPLTLIFVAESIFKYFKDGALASSTLERAERLLKSGLWQPSEDDLPLESYERRITEVRKQIEPTSL